MDAVHIIIRDFNPEKDEALIYSSWRNAYYSLIEKPEGLPHKYFSEKSKQIQNLLKTATVKIACYADSPSIIVGYSVSTGNHLDFVYVKDGFRKQGIATLLMPKNIETVTNEITKIGKAIIEKKNLITKGESNGRIINNKDRKEINPNLH